MKAVSCALCVVLSGGLALHPIDAWSGQTHKASIKRGHKKHRGHGRATARSAPITKLYLPADLWVRVREGLQLPRPALVEMPTPPMPPQPDQGADQSAGTGPASTPSAFAAATALHGLQDSSPDTGAPSGHVPAAADEQTLADGTTRHTAAPLPSDDPREGPEASTGVTPEGFADAYEQQLQAFEEQKRQYAIYAQVEAQVAWYLQRLSFVRQSVARAVPYLYLIVAELEKNHLPLDLALLPIVESGYKPHAESPKKASGIWQFIPSTGQIYGLKQSETYDGRLDIAASTHAAAAYLAHLKRRFKGDWALALASYNCGEGAVERAIARNHAAGLPTDFWSLDLPAETKAYVPRLLALSTIFSNPGAYRLKLVPVPNQPYLTSVKLDQVMTVDTLSWLAGLGAEYFMYLNPGFIGSVVGGDGAYELLLPRPNMETFQRQLELFLHPTELSLAALIRPAVRGAGSGMLRGDAVKVTLASYTVDPNRRDKPFHVSDTPPAGALGGGIRWGNDGVPHASGTSMPAETRAGAASAPPGKDARKSSHGKPAKVEVVYVHEASAGETVEKVARYYNLPVSVLVTANKLKPRKRLQPGDKLTIPLEQAVPLDLMNAGGTGVTAWALRTPPPEARVASSSAESDRAESTGRERSDSMPSGKRCFQGWPHLADLPVPIEEEWALFSPLRSCDFGTHDLRTADCGKFTGSSPRALVMK